MANKFESAENQPMSQTDARRYLDTLEQFEQDGPQVVDSQELKAFVDEVAERLHIEPENGVVTIGAAKEALLNRLGMPDGK